MEGPTDQASHNNYADDTILFMEHNLEQAKKPQVPREVLKKLDFYRSRFFWQSNEHKKSIG